MVYFKMVSINSAIPKSMSSGCEIPLLVDDWFVDSTALYLYIYIYLDDHDPIEETL